MKHRKPTEHGHLDTLDPTTLDTQPFPVYARIEPDLPGDDRPTLRLPIARTPRHALPARPARFGWRDWRLSRWTVRVRDELALLVCGLVIGGFFGALIGLAW